MPRKKHSAEEIIRKLREAEVLLAQGRTVPEVSRILRVSEQTYFRWRKEYGGLKMDQAKRFKELERENARLKRAVADLTLDKLILRRRRETSEHCPPSALRAPCSGDAWRFRASVLSGSRSGPIDPTACCQSA